MSFGLDSLGLSSLGLFGGGVRREYAITVLPVRHNWFERWQEIYNWQTSILTASSGVEQRIRLRSNARVKFMFSVVQFNDVLQHLEALVYASRRNFVALPLHAESVILTTNSTGSSIECDTRYRAFYTGQFLLIGNPAGKYEIAECQEVADEGITLPQSLNAPWPKGTRVYPLLLGRLTQNKSISYKTVSAATSTFEFEVSAGQYKLPDQVATDTYSGLEVLWSRPNWSDDIEVATESPYMPIDNAGGVFDRLYLTDHSVQIFPHRWFLRSPQDIYNFKTFIKRRGGMQKAFWYFSPIKAGELLNSPTSTGNKIVLNGTWFANVIGTSNGRRRIAFCLHNGTKVIVTVQSVSVINTDSEIETTAPIGANFTPADVRYVGYLLKCRLAADQVTISRLTDSFADPQLFFRTLIE